MSIGLLGKKIGMTSIYDANGKMRPVTVIAAGDNTLLRRLTSENDGYSAIQVGFDTQKESRVTKALLGGFGRLTPSRRNSCASFASRKTRRKVRSISPSRNFNRAIGSTSIGKSKGKGFQGVMKKHNFHGQGAAHGSKTHRRNGAIGNRSTPGRIWKNMGMPGHMGDERVTVQNLQVLQVREADKVILISGAVPGANGSYVVVRPALKIRRNCAVHAEHRGRRS